MIENAKIESAVIRMDRGVFLTAWLHLSGPGWGQGYGGYIFNDKPKERGGERFCSTGFGAECIQRIMQTFGVQSWDELKGKPVRIEHDDAPASARKIIAVGHYLEDKWFSFEEVAKEFQQEEK